MKKYFFTKNQLALKLRNKMKETVFKQLIFISFSSMLGMRYELKYIINFSWINLFHHQKKKSYKLIFCLVQLYIIFLKLLGANFLEDKFKIKWQIN